jgi:hypothetical protein
MPTRTFSTAVMFLKRRMFWNVRQTPSAVIWSGRSPRSEAVRNVTEPSSGT